MKRLLCLILTVVLLLSLIPLLVFADSSDMGLHSLANGESYQDMTVSQDMLDMIKVMEGFNAEPYADNTQWSIGYGSFCGDIDDPKPDITWTEEEASEELVRALNEEYGAKVNDYCEKLGKQPSQHQYDALTSFTYNLGWGWMSSTNRLNTWIQEPTTEIELVNAMGVWARVGKSVNYAICCRRIREAIVFLRGEYSIPFVSTDVETELPVVSNNNLPYYKFIIFQGNGGTMQNDKSDVVRYYHADEAYGEFEIPVREGYSNIGWTVTRINGESTNSGLMMTEGDVALDNLELTATWVESSEDVTAPTDPVEPTDPSIGLTPNPTEPTEPSEPTEPEEPTEPVEKDEPVELPFYDVDEDDWFYDNVNYVYRHGYMNGVETDEFAPHFTMTRGMLVTVLYRIQGSPQVTQEEREVFTDTQNSWYTDAVAWARANGIVNGMTETEFVPNGKVTRQDAISIFYRYCVTYLGVSSEEWADLLNFADADKVAQYAYEPMEWAVAVGLVSGSADGDGVYLNPRGNLTRCQGAALLDRCVNQIINGMTE